MVSLLHFKLFTLFSDMFPGTLGFSLAGKALKKNIWSYETIDIRNYALDKYKQVDDYQYGGGDGLVMRADIVGKAIDDNVDDTSTIYYMSPKGKPIDNTVINQILCQKEITIICGRYEGLDQRVIDEYKIKEICVGDVVISGGEPAAILLMDAVIRKIPGVISNIKTLKEESFSKIFDDHTVLEYPLYTKPVIWKNRIVPSVLLSGHHKKIREWKKEMSMDLTRKRRPSILIND